MASASVWRQEKLFKPTFIVFPLTLFMVYIHEHRNQLEIQCTGIRTDTVSQHIRDTAMKDSQAREPQRFCVNLDSLDEIPSKHEILHVW